MMRQLPPMIRFDGYHLLADVTGVPDLFHRIKPTLLGLLADALGTAGAQDVAALGQSGRHAVGAARRPAHGADCAGDRGQPAADPRLVRRQRVRALACSALASVQSGVRRRGQRGLDRDGHAAGAARTTAEILPPMPSDVFNVMSADRRRAPSRSCDVPAATVDGAGMTPWGVSEDGGGDLDGRRSALAVARQWFVGVDVGRPPRSSSQTPASAASHCAVPGP